MDLPDWKKCVDEIARMQVGSLLLRGGEVFLYPHIGELLEYILARGLYISIDTNGTLLDEFAEQLVSIGNVHLTISIDGPEEVHDYIRGNKGCFARVKRNLEIVREIERHRGVVLSKSMTFTISEDNYEYLGEVSALARELSIPTVTIVPRYWLPHKAGEMYEQEMMEFFGCTAYSWRGFTCESHVIDPLRLVTALQEYRDALQGIKNFPYMPLSDAEYVSWFGGFTTRVGSPECPNISRLIDIQPDGRVNFCVDFPDFSIGNVRESSLEQLWNSANAEMFRTVRTKREFAVCRRCGAKYMATILDKLN